MVEARICVTVTSLSPLTIFWQKAWWPNHSVACQPTAEPTVWMTMRFFVTVIMSELVVTESECSKCGRFWQIYNIHQQTKPTRTKVVTPHSSRPTRSSIARTRAFCIECATTTCPAKSSYTTTGPATLSDTSLACSDDDAAINSMSSLRWWLQSSCCWWAVRSMIGKGWWKAFKKLFPGVNRCRAKCQHQMVI